MGQKSATYWHWPLIGVIPVLLLVVALACDDSDNPVGPGQPEEFTVFCHDGLVDWYYDYDILNGRLDSLRLGHDVHVEMVFSPDGDRLYMSAWPASIAVYDWDSRQLIAELPYRASQGLSLSPDGRLLAALDIRTLRIFDTRDLSVLFLDSMPAISGAFNSDNSLFVCGLSDPDYSMCLLDLSTYPPTRMLKSLGPWSAVEAILSPDGEVVFLMLVSYDWNTSWFVAFDVDADSIVYDTTLHPGQGDMVMTPDGRYVFFTNDGSEISEVPPSSSFLIYDTEVNAIVQEVSTVGLKDGINPTYFPIQELALSPDGRLLIGKLSYRFFVFDIASMKFTHYDDSTNVGHLTSHFTTRPK